MDSNSTSKVILPQKLAPGDRVALIAPAFHPTPEQINQAIEQLQTLQLQVVNKIISNNNDGYFNASGPEIISQLHEAFVDPSIKAVIAVRGGYGCARLLPELDWALIASNPKIILGFSDISALLLAIHAHTGLVTFHGPSASKSWPKWTLTGLQKVLFEAKPHRFEYIHPREVKILRPGCAQGTLVGGNLSVITSLIGTGFLPKYWHDKILFLEDVNEEVYRLDRMLMQLHLAGILPQIKGLIFGCFNHCSNKVPFSFDILELQQRFCEKYSYPVLTNMTFGHQAEMHTLPIGSEVLLNADDGYIELFHSVVN